MSDKIRFDQSSWGRWYCYVTIDGSEEIEIGYGMDQTELLEKAVRFMGIELEYKVDGKVVK